MELLEFVIELDIQYCLEVKGNMILYKHFMGSIPLRIRFDEINGVMKIYDGVRC